MAPPPVLDDEDADLLVPSADDARKARIATLKADLERNERLLEEMQRKDPLQAAIHTLAPRRHVRGLALFNEYSDDRTKKYDVPPLPKEVAPQRLPRDAAVVSDALVLWWFGWCIRIT